MTATDFRPEDWDKIRTTHIDSDWPEDAKILIAQYKDYAQSLRWNYTSVAVERDRLRDVVNGINLLLQAITSR